LHPGAGKDELLVLCTDVAKFGAGKIGRDPIYITDEVALTYDWAPINWFGGRSWDFDNGMCILTKDGFSGRKTVGSHIR